MEYVTINARVGRRTRRALGVVKERYGLKDVGEAIDKFVEMHDEELVEPEVKEELVREVIRSCDEHIKKHGFRKMSLDELRQVCGA